ncbi:MAG: outer membrane beta-barrel protein [Holophagales bacterium]|nr:outer membrane beta-barrel protein [Holophagales bacterium]
MPRLVVLAALLLATVAPASAQEAAVGELTPFIGLRAGGGLDDAGNGETYAIESALSWGVAAGISLGSPNLLVEATYLQQSTRLSAENPFSGGDGNLHDLRLQTILGGVQWDFSPRARVRPLLSAGVGATFLEGQGGGMSTSFTASLSGGVKLMVSRTIGVRLEARALALFSGGSLRGLCQWSDCLVGLTGWGTLQAEASVGTLFSF